jgi:HEPN domain-containing protein
VARATPIPRVELKKIALARIKDAECLFASKRYDGARYVCGYAVEIALKARVCRHLNWGEFLPSNLDDGLYRLLMTHKFALLLSLTGLEQSLRRSALWNDWNTVATWDPELRYKLRSATRAQAEAMIQSTKELVR